MANSDTKRAHRKLLISCVCNLRNWDVFQGKRQYSREKKEIIIKKVIIILIMLILKMLITHLHRLKSKLRATIETDDNM